MEISLKSEYKCLAGNLPSLIPLSWFRWPWVNKFGKEFEFVYTASIRVSLYEMLIDRVWINVSLWRKYDLDGLEKPVKPG
jgi:hypothetical protein